jgi:hypothetical protein
MEVLGPDPIGRARYALRVGTWAWLRRGDGDDAEEIHLDRSWHALHVALTGETEEGEPPGTWVLWSAPGAADTTLSSASFAHPAERVIEIADWLRHVVDFDRALADLDAALELGEYVYALAPEGALRRSFDEVTAFYSRAAAAGQTVSVRRA